MADNAEETAEQVGDNRPVRRLARVGLVAYGLVHLLIGWTAFRVALGAADPRSADTSGAMNALAGQPLGRVLLWLVAVGLLALALWQASEVVWGGGGHELHRRVPNKVTSACRAVVYLVLAGSAVSAALGTRSSSSGKQQQAASGVLALPGGQVLVVAVGLVIVGVGIGMIVKGVAVSIGDEIDLAAMSPSAREIARRLGQTGYVTKGVAFTIVGGLLGYTAVTFDRRKAQGLDGALQTILAQPFGKYLLIVAAIGFACFGLYAMLQSRFRRM